MVRVNNKVFSVPSPLQASILVKEKQIPFDFELLNKSANYVKYLTTFKQSLNIGVYGANLGNLFIYDQLSKSAEYFNVIKKLAEQVGVMNSIDQKLIDRIEQSNQDRDSMMYILADVFREIDNYLLENEQEELGILIITGGWVESVYMLLKIIESDKDPDLIARIGEQQQPLNNLIELLQPYYNEKTEDFDYLLEALVELSILFDAIEINYVYKESEVDIENRITYINSTTTYNITESELILISNKIESLRNWVISE